MPRWTEEARQKHRELIYRTKPWEYDTRQKTAWGKECSRWNGYRTMKRNLQLNEQHLIAIAAARGLLEALRITINQGAKLTRQHIEDFRLAIRILYKFSNASRDISVYSDISKALATCEITEDTPPMDGSDSESSNLAIASRALRTIAKQYSSTRKILLASSDQQVQQMEQCLSLLD